MRQHAVRRLNRDQRYIENRGDGKSGSERCRRMAMATGVTVVMAVVMAVMVVMMMTVAMFVRLMRRHAVRLSIARADATFCVGEQRAPESWRSRIM
jgi:hypothetical protein